MELYGAVELWSRDIVKLGGGACGRAAWTGARARACARAACACMGAPTSSASWGCAQLQVQTCSRHRASRHKHVSGWGRAARRNLDADEGAPRVRPSGSGHEARRGHGGSGEGGREACPVASLFGWEPNAGGQYSTGSPVRTGAPANKSMLRAVSIQTERFLRAKSNASGDRRVRARGCGAVELSAPRHTRGAGIPNVTARLGWGGTKKNLEAEDGSGGEAVARQGRSGGEAVARQGRSGGEARDGRWRGKGRAVWSRGRADQAFCHKSELRSCNRGTQCGLLELRSEKAHKHLETQTPWKLRGRVVTV